MREEKKYKVAEKSPTIVGFSIRKKEDVSEREKYESERRDLYSYINHPRNK